jgi:hypothetical protein
MTAAAFLIPQIVFARSASGLGVVNVTPTPAMQQMAAAIQQMEGYSPGSVSYTNNNPGNLVYAGQPGATAGPNGFAVFDSYQDGLQALYNQLGAYSAGTCSACGGQPLTVAQMTAIYAPAGQGSNDPAAYASFLSSSLGVDPNASLSDIFSGGSTFGAEGLGLDLSDPTTIAVLGMLTAGLLYAFLG